MVGTIAGILVLGLGWTGMVALGSWLTWRGANGRMVDRTPHCRRCGYLLVSTPRRPARCSECGAVLAAPGAVRLGRRRRSAPMAVAGSMLLASAAGVTWHMLRPQARITPIARALAAPGGRALVPPTRGRRASTAPPPRRVEPPLQEAPGGWSIHDLYMPSPPQATGPGIDVDVEGDVEVEMARRPGRRAESARPAAPTPVANASWDAWDTWDAWRAWDARGSQWPGSEIDDMAIAPPALGSPFEPFANGAERIGAPIRGWAPVPRRRLETAPLEPVDDLIEHEPVSADRIDRRTRPERVPRRSRH